MRNKLSNTIQSYINPLIPKLEELTTLLTRGILGWVFLESGYGKLKHLDKVISYFTELGIPLPQLQAPFVACIELLGGIALLIGLASRLFSVLLIGVMAVALLTAKKEDISSFSDLFSMTEFLYILLFLWIIVKGAGRVSISGYRSVMRERTGQKALTQ